MARRHAGDFGISYRNFEHYPENLLDRSLVRGYPQSLLKSLSRRLKEERTLRLLFYHGKNATKCNLGILDLDQDGRFVGPTTIVRINDDNVLRNFLGDTAPELAPGSDFPSKVDPNCRFM